MHTGGKIDAPKREMIEKLTAEVIRFWRAEENGIWEVMDKRPFTYGKIMCWVALERARELRGDKDGAIAEACAAIKAEIMERGIVDHSGQKILSSEMDKMELDASSLLAFTTGFLPEYLAKSTREAIEQDLSRGSFLRRNNEIPEEGSFLLCSFFWINHLIREGHLARARSC
jgi:GH15 family glucan-1,4-alpha-glucosidase